METRKNQAERHRLRVPVPVERIPSQNARPHFLGYAHDVSRTGLFLQCVLPPPVGTRMRLRLSLPGDQRTVIAGSAHVVWVREYRGWRAPPAGVGLQLDDMDDGARRAWTSFCQTVP